MKKLEIVKIISILLVFVSVISILSGCGGANNNEIKFRDISFGTKYSKVMPKITNDLKGQGYNSEPEMEIDEGFNIVQVHFYNIKLYDYDNVEIELEFLKEDNQDINDAKLICGRYRFDFYTYSGYNKGAAKSCYKFFNEKLTELYGEKTKITMSGIEYEVWKKGNTICCLPDETEHSGFVTIVYGFDDFMEQRANSIKAEEENKNSNANKGL